MTPDALHAALYARGYLLTAHGDTLHVSPKEGLTPEDRAAIREHKPGLLALLMSAQRPLEWTDKQLDYSPMTGSYEEED